MQGLANHLWGEERQKFLLSNGTPLAASLHKTLSKLGLMLASD